MANFVGCGSRAGGRASNSFGVWLNPTWDAAFAWKRGLLLLAGVGLQAGLLFAKQGVLSWLVLLFALWPFPFRVRVDQRGVRVAWSIVTARIPWSEIAFSELVTDPREGVVGERQSVVRIVRRRADIVTVYGRPAVLSALHAEIAKYKEPANTGSWPAVTTV